MIGGIDMLKRVASFVFVVAFAASAVAADSAAQKAFARLKKLQGSWVEKSSATEVKITFKLTGAGSALVETQLPGTEYEMVTVYHLDGKDLVLTHYCAAQNQPHMKLVPGKDPNVLNFDFVSVSNLKPKAGYMRSVKYRLIDDDHFVSEWSYFANGKAGGTQKFELTRAKASK
jgi:hypothetical protein